jgi:hypothetical protein
MLGYLAVMDNSDAFGCLYGDYLRGDVILYDCGDRIGCLAALCLALLKLGHVAAGLAGRARASSGMAVDEGCGLGVLAIRRADLINNCAIALDGEACDNVDEFGGCGYRIFHLDCLSLLVRFRCNGGALFLVLQYLYYRFYIEPS